MVVSVVGEGEAAVLIVETEEDEEAIEEERDVSHSGSESHWMQMGISN